MSDTIDFSHCRVPTDDFPALVTTLQAAAQAILLYCEQGSPPESVKAESAKSGEETSASPENPGELRCYHFSPLALRQEEELFEEQDVNDLRGLLFNACSSLTAFTVLMENIEAEAELDGAVIHILARELKRTEDLLFRIQDAYSTVERKELPMTA